MRSYGKTRTGSKILAIWVLAAGVALARPAALPATQTGTPETLQQFIAYREAVKAGLVDEQSASFFSHRYLASELAATFRSTMRAESSATNEYLLETFLFGRRVIGIVRYEEVPAAGNAVKQLNLWVKFQTRKIATGEPRLLRLRWVREEGEYRIDGIIFDSTTNATKYGQQIVIDFRE